MSSSPGGAHDSFGESVQGVKPASDHEVQRARRVVADLARDVEDARLLLSMLGITPDSDCQPLLCEQGS